MTQYEVKRRLYDNLNGLAFSRGDYIETEDDLWVARFGSDLRPRVAPEHIKVAIVHGTIEGSSKVEEVKEEVEEVKEPEPAKEERPTGRAKVQVRGDNKAILGDDSNAK